MAMTVFGVIVTSWGLLAQDQIPAVGGLAGGVTGVGALGAIVWLINRHSADMEKKTECFSKALESSRTLLVSELTRKDAQITDIITKFDGALREMRAENQRNIERQFEHSREVVAALEHVNDSLLELSGRIKTLEDGSGTHPPLPAGPNPRRPGGR